MVVLLLAAGAGSRFHGAQHKLLTPLDGRPLVEHAIVHALDASVGPVVVVTGAVGLDLPAALAAQVTTLHHPAWYEGQAGSLEIGVRAADSLGADHVLVGLGDQPGIPPAAWRAVAAAPADWPVVVASYAGRRGPHPVRLHRSVWSLLTATGDDGARTLMREHPALVHEVACPGTAADIDTLEDVQRWKSS